MIRAIQTTLQKFYTIGRYSIIAGAGWLVDTCTLLLLTYTGVPVFWAATAGILLGSSFAYAFATRHIFTDDAGFCWRKWTVFMVFTIITTVIWSALIDAISRLGLWPIAAKIAILPITFYTNFLFMGWLQEGRVRWR